MTVALVFTGGEGGGLDLSVRGGDNIGASAELSAAGFYIVQRWGCGVARRLVIAKSRWGKSYLERSFFFDCLLSV